MGECRHMCVGGKLQKKDFDSLVYQSNVTISYHCQAKRER